MSKHVVQSVGDAIRSVLPKGANPESVLRLVNLKGSQGDKRSSWLLPPHMPTDLFAACAHLCQIGGVLGFFNPSPYADPSNSFQLIFDRDFRDELDTIAWEWRGGIRGGHPEHPKRKKKCKPSERPPSKVEEYWNVLLDNWDKPVNCGYYVHTESDPNPPEWWKAALSLVVVSDLAVVRPFLDPIKRFNGTPFGELLCTLYQIDDRAVEGLDGDESGEQTEEDADTEVVATQPAPRGPASLTFMADSSFVCVMPKIRVAPVGAMLRNVTRNLALLPGRGQMRCFWDMTDAEPESEDRETLDILLIPAPITLNATDFRAESSENTGKKPSEKHNDKPNWENFHLDQSWIGTADSQETLLRECTDLLKKAKAETRTVNGVILPEYALTYPVFDRLCGRLKEASPNLEFVISGSSSNCDGEIANTLLTRVWRNRDPLMHITNSRRKHHRWRLDRHQVESYGLGTVLNPKISNWWETSAIGQREMYFHRFRTGSVFAALICEELARSDVCHDILRAVGPNLVFALLMDSAQIPSRWSAQYAGSLADDPGCAVLSFTSYGLVERSNRHRKNGSTAIALWKDDDGNLVEINMPSGQGTRGVLLSLWSEHVKDQTIAGKRSLVRAWRYSSHCSVSA